MGARITIPQNTNTLSYHMSTRRFHRTYGKMYFLHLGTRIINMVGSVRVYLDKKTSLQYYYLTDALYKELIDSSIETVGVVNAD